MAGLHWLVDVSIVAVVALAGARAGSSRASELVAPVLKAEELAPALKTSRSVRYRAQLLFEQCQSKRRTIRDADAFDDCPDETIVEAWTPTSSAPNVPATVNQAFFVSDQSETTMWCGSGASSLALKLSSPARIRRISVTFGAKDTMGRPLARLARVRLEAGDEHLSLDFPSAGEDIPSRTAAIDLDATTTSFTIIPEPLSPARVGQPHCLTTVEIQGRGVIAPSASTAVGTPIFAMGAVPPEPFTKAARDGPHTGTRPVAVTALPQAPTPPLNRQPKQRSKHRDDVDGPAEAAPVRTTRAECIGACVKGCNDDVNCEHICVLVNCALL